MSPGPASPVLSCCDADSFGINLKAFSVAVCLCLLGTALHPNEGCYHYRYPSLSMPRATPDPEPLPRFIQLTPPTFESSLGISPVSHSKLYHITSRIHNLYFLRGGDMAGHLELHRHWNHHITLALTFNVHVPSLDANVNQITAQRLHYAHPLTSLPAGNFTTTGASLWSVSEN